uniref:Uncharacterized protein n=1 Tax=Buteo japonicus TaxID=224669 RepID=A0A8C0C042_9AVES
CGCFLHPSVHAAVLAINEAVDRGVVAQTMMALRNPSAMLLDLREVLAGAYQEVLHRAKLEKGTERSGLLRPASDHAGSRAGCFNCNSLCSLELWDDLPAHLLWV